METEGKTTLRITDLHYTEAYTFLKLLFSFSRKKLFYFKTWITQKKFL